ncbi:MAG: hypothetical protein IT267_05165 [Saprospiraceae bacterium]|nr:hypothetical protein [Saprospiraceae bacterium]
MKNLILKGMALYALMLIGLSSCQKDELATSDVENFVQETIYELQFDGGIGKLGCFELIFPVQISFPDGTNGSYSSYDELIAAFKDWRLTHSKSEGKPEFIFPIDVLKKDGTTITVNSKEELKDLRKECPGRHNRGPKGHINRGLSCFELTYPLTLIFPNSNELTVSSKEEFRSALKSWRELNPGRPVSHPKIKFPYSVILKEDGTTVTLNSREDLIALKDKCE